MSDRSDILKHIKDTHEVVPGRTDVKRRLPFGLLSVVASKWSVEGEGEAGVNYNLEVTEYERRGRLAALFRSEPDITAKLLVMSPEPTAVYIAHMAADGSTRFEGAVRPAPSADISSSHTMPSTIPPREAAAGFDASLDAHFVQG